MPSTISYQAKNLALFVASLVCYCSRQATAFPSGAPLSACSHLMPVHIDGELQEKASPYVLVVNDTTYDTKPLKLTVSAVGPSERDFMAFMLQARSEFGETAGHFSQAPVASKPMTCYHTDDTLTHTAAFIRPSMEVLWHPPGKNIGRVAFTGSIAVNKIKFWSVQSNYLKGEGKLDLSLAKLRNGSEGVASFYGGVSTLTSLHMIVLLILKIS
ncbi:ferric-chelate reductase 1 [Elysia marginata]|uniref:Ferric-chelate reductase 1 n=1 Tax=Elysia marginata TaxID=1093978 RepID=A0AAV4HLL8_9GAST|nr:ferric-chelate reductase 1 [Elysia marginata]